MKKGFDPKKGSVTNIRKPLKAQTPSPFMDLSTAVKNEVNKTAGVLIQQVSILSRANSLFRQSLEVLQTSVDVLKRRLNEKGILSEEEYQKGFAICYSDLQLAKMKINEEALDGRDGVQDSDLEAEDGDVVIMKYEAHINDEEFEANKADYYRLKIGGPESWTELGASLIGKKKGEKYSINFKFPDNEIRKDIAGKEAIFDVEVLKVKKKIKVEGDNESGN